MEFLEIVPKSGTLPIKTCASQVARGNGTRQILKQGSGPLPLIEDDPLLALLTQASNDELDPLVEILKEKGGLTSQLEATASFQNCYPNHVGYVRNITADIQKFGANTIVSRFFRAGKGVMYQEILSDVASRFGISSSGKAAGRIEREIITKFLQEAYEKMSPEQKRQMLISLEITDRRLLLASAATEAIRVAIQHSGFAAYKGSVIIANGVAHQLLGHGLSFATNAVLTKGISIFVGPVGLAFTGLLACNAFAGPAYRVTVPVVLQVAAIRASHEQQTASSWDRLIVFIRTHRVFIAVLLCIVIAMVLLRQWCG
jgi:uncharacterized protein YaaW (UPF0174 family)